MKRQTTHDAVSQMAPAFATFRAKLLDPRPLVELMTADMRKDMAKAWRKGMRDLDYAKHGHFYEAIGFDTGIVGHTRAVRDQMWANYQAAMAEQALIPAPTATELRWKMRLMKHIRERADVAAAIAADEARSIIDAIEPWYNWGRIGVERMESLRPGKTAADGEVRFFELQWLGIHVGFQMGRTPKGAR